MKEDEMLMCLICFVLGYIVARMMRGNGFSISSEETWRKSACRYVNKPGCREGMSYDTQHRCESDRDCCTQCDKPRKCFTVTGWCLNKDDPHFSGDVEMD